MRFIKDKWCALSSWPRVPPTQWLEDAVGGSWEWQWTGFQKDTRKPSLDVSSRAWTLANQSFGLVAMETDRQQLRGKREQQLRLHPGLRQPWWGRGSAPPFLPQIQRLLSAPQRPRLPDLVSCQGHKGRRGSAGAPSLDFLLPGQRPPAALLSFWSKQIFRRWVPGPREGSPAPALEVISHWRWIPECWPPEANLAPCSVAVSPENLAGALTSHCLGRELEAEPRGNSVNDGVYCSRIWCYTDIINLWLQALSSLAGSCGLSLETEGGREGAWDPGCPSPLSQLSCQKAVAQHLRFLLSGKRRNEAEVLVSSWALGSWALHVSKVIIWKQSLSVEEEQSWENAEATAE